MTLYKRDPMAEDQTIDEHESMIVSKRKTNGMFVLTRLYRRNQIASDEEINPVFSDLLERVNSHKAILERCDKQGRPMPERDSVFLEAPTPFHEPSWGGDYRITAKITDLQNLSEEHIKTIDPFKDNPGEYDPLDEELFDRLKIEYLKYEPYPT